MKFETVTVTQRKNIGNYEHIEITTTARIDEGEDFIAVAMTARTYVEAILNMPLDEVKEHKEPVKSEPVTFDEETGQNRPVSEVKAKKDKKTKKVKEEVAPEITEVEVPSKVEVELDPPKKKAPKNIVVYNSNVQEHKSIFGGYLNKKYGNAWKDVKPKEDIQSFTKSLNGKEFLDDSGAIVESFLNEVHNFFGA